MITPFKVTLLALMVSVCVKAQSVAGYDVKWTKIKHCTLSGLTLSMEHASDFGTANSLNRFSPVADKGTITYTLTDLTGNNAFGFNDTLNDIVNNRIADNISNIDFGFYYQGDKQILWAAKQGSMENLAENLEEGSVIQLFMNPETGMVDFIVNDEVITSYDYGSTKPYVISCVLARDGFLTGLMCNFKPKPIAIQLAKEHPTNDNASSGIIVLLANGGAPPYVYNWAGSAIDTNIRVGMPVGTYTCTVTDSYNDSMVVETSLGLKNNWKLQKNMSVTNDTYTKTSTITSSAAALVSYNIIPRDKGGFCELTMADTTNHTAFGFLGFNVANIDPHYSSPYVYDDALNSLLGYADSLLMNGKINVTGDFRTADAYSKLHLVYFNGGTVKVGFKQYTSYGDGVDFTYKEGDLFSLSTNGTLISLYKNKKLIATETISSQYLLTSLFVTQNSTRIKNPASLALDPDFIKFAGIPVYICGEPNLNWVRTRTFDENGTIKSDGKTFMDMIGRTIQSQTKLFSANNVLVSEPLYDSYGRAVGQSLPAPSFNTDICYVPNFIEITPGVSYSANDFDHPVGTGVSADIMDAFNAHGDVNNARPVNSSSMGKLGWYYSNANTAESFVAADDLPYARTEFYDNGRPRRSAGVGTNLKMGSGHETKFIYTSTPEASADPLLNELNYVFPYRTYELEKDFSIRQSNPNYNLQLFKTIAINPDGKDQISYTNSSGQTIATCITGDGTGCVTHQDIKQLFPVVTQEKIQYIYIPKNKAGTFRFAELVANQPVATAAVPVLKDVNRNTNLISGTDYTYNASTGYFTFSGNYAGKSLYLQVTYTTSTPPPNTLVAMVDVDYTQWTLYFYDRKGRLLANTSPNDVVCQNLPYSVQKTGSTAGAPDPCNPNGGLIVPIVLQSSGTNGTAFINIKPIASAINSFTFTSPYVFKSNAQKRYQDSIYVIANPPVVDSNRVMLPVDTNFTNIGMPDSSTIVFYRMLDSLETKIPLNALAGKKITYTGNFSFYKKIRGQAASTTPMVTVPYGFEIHSTGQLNATGGVITEITPLTSTSFPVKLDLAELSTIESISVKTENITTNFEGFMGDATIDPNMCSGEYYVPINLHPVLDALNHAVGMNVDVDISNIPVPISIKMANRYMYDEYDRLVGSINEDQGTVYYVYDQLEDKLLFTQNDKQRANGAKFSCIVYDKLGRPVISGEYKGITGATTPFKFQNYYDYKNGVAVTSGFLSTGVAAYANSSAYNDGRIIDATYMQYDNADATLPTNMANSLYAQKYTAAKVSKTYNAQSTTWYSYDELGRQVWSVQNSAELGYKTMNYTYDMRGKLQTSLYQASAADNILHTFAYDTDERLTASNFGIGTNPAANLKPVAKYSYYLHGALKRTLLGNNLQGLDYIYTIDGKLKSVNNPISTLTNLDPGMDGYATGPNAAVSPDAFSFALEYYPNDYYRANSPVNSYNYVSAYNDDNTSYTGLVKAFSWRTKLPTAATANYTDALMYEYTYDELYQLKGAQFGTVNETSPGVGHPLRVDNFTRLPEYKLDNISYDKNGNLQSLKRYAAPINTTTAHLLDDLAYNYSSTQKNSLLNIKDLATNTAGYTAELDLPNQPVTTNYVYNEIGELVANTQENKGFEYNAQGLTQRVFNLTNGYNIVAFTYNDKGLRHCKTSYNASNVAIKATYYSYDAGGAQVASYTKDLLAPAPVTILKDFTLYSAGRVGTYDVAGTSALFELTDQLGNTRAVVGNDSHGNFQIYSYIDYYPHGGSMPGRNYISSLNFPYGYQGQEKDAETGLTNFELRQYDARIGRWYNPDPNGQHHSPYLAMSNNPVSSIDPDGGWDWSARSDDGGSARDNTNVILSTIESAQGKSYDGMSPLERSILAKYNGKTYESQFTNRIMDNVDSFGSYSERGKDYYYSDKRGLYGYWSDYVEKPTFRTGKVGNGHDGKAFEAATLGTNVGWRFHRIGGDEFNTKIRLDTKFKNDLMIGLKTAESINPISNGWDATSMLINGTDKYGNEGNFTSFAYASLGAFPGGNIEKGLANNEMTTVIGRMDDLVKYADNASIDTWHKSGIFGSRVTWAQNKAWLDARILRGDKFSIATNPTSLPSVINGYVPGMPNGYFTARELQYLNSKGIKVNFVGN